MVTGKKYKIGWIGTGVMGTPMFGHILNAGFTGYVYNRTKSKALPLIKKGAEWKDNPELIAASADITFTIVGYPEDVKDVYFGKRGLFSGAGEGKIFVDMTTTSPSLAIEIYNTARNKGMSSIDAPVSGGDVECSRNVCLNLCVICNLSFRADIWRTAQISNLCSERNGGSFPLSIRYIYF